MDQLLHNVEPNAEAELWELASRSCNDELRPEDVARINILLADDPQARQFFGFYMLMHGEMAWRFRGGRDDEQISDEVQVASLPVLPTTHYQLPTNFVGGPVFSYMVATVVLCLMLLGAWAYKINHDRNIAHDNSRRSTTSGPSELVFVGRVTGMKNCHWANEGESTIIGALVSLNREYALASGLLEITYKSGARVILEGPCKYKAESSVGGFLELGKLTARIDGAKSQTVNPEPRTPNPEPRNSSFIPHPSSFVVRTPTAIVTDLGTEFGVEVDANGDTFSHVFQGSIKVQGLAASVASGPAPMETILRVNESARVVRDAAGSRLVVGSEVGDIPRFVQKMPDPSSTERTFAIDGRVFQEDFVGESIDSEKWSVNIRRSGDILVAAGSATIHTDALSPEGTAALQSVALDFSDSPDDWWVEIRFKMDGALTSGGFDVVRDWIVLAGFSQTKGKWETQGIDIRAMQRGGVESGTFDLGWWGWDNKNDARIPVALARDLDKGRFYSLAIHRKPDDVVDIYLDGRKIGSKQLIGSVDPALLCCGDVSGFTGGTQIIDRVTIGALASETSTGEQSQKEKPPMEQ